MRCDGVHLAGGAVWLPDRQPVADAVASGRYDAGEQAANAYDTVTVAGAGDDDAPPRMAARAGAAALARSGVDPDEVDLLLHASLWFQGVDFWGAAAYVHDQVLHGNRHAPALDVQQMSNGGLGALELAASYLQADPGRRSAVVTTGDRFHLPAFDRWRSDLPGIVYGDGAVGVVLSRSGGFARLLAIRTVVDTGLEGVYRGDGEFGLVPGDAVRPVDNRRRRQEFADRTGPDDVVGRAPRGVVEAVEATVADAGVAVADISRFVFPSVGREVLCKGYLEHLGVPVERTTFDLARQTAHVGAGDQLIGLVRLVEERALAPGDLVMLVGIGAGFSWTGAVVEMLEQPAW